MTLNTNMNGEMKGNLAGELKGDMAFKIEGPIQIQMQGPTIKYEGTYISDPLYEIVKPGETTSDWIIAVFGEPNVRTELRDGTEVWRWTYKPIAQESAIIEVFGSDEKKEPKLTTRTVFVQIRDDVVIQKWKG